MQHIEHRVRATIALQRLTALTHEKQALAAHLLRAPLHERVAVQQRLSQIEYELDHIQDERRRAAAGATVAPRLDLSSELVTSARLPLDQSTCTPTPRRRQRERRPRNRLNREQVEAILQKYAEHRRSRGIVTQLASEYQVTKSTISDIVARRTWRHLDPPCDSG